MSALERLLAQMQRDADTANQLHAQSRELLIAAARAGAAAGLSQREIAAAIGRSQPEVSRLLRFHGTSTLGRTLTRHRGPVIDLIHTFGGRNPRVFGSVAAGTDGPTSDIDLLVDFADAMSLLTLARLERELGELLGAPVDVIPAADLRTNLKDRVLQQAVPL